jgi:polyhydroxybutyrate depolymerase
MHGHNERLLSGWTALLAFMGATACTPHIDQVALRTPGDHEAAFEHGGVERDMLVHVPTGYRADNPTPLLVVLHGGGSSGAAMADVTGFRAIADREGFVSVFPNALGFAHGMWRIWNAGNCSAPSCVFGVDDVGMVAAVIDLLEHRLAIDPARIYLVGYSNGGALAYDVAARMTDRFAGLAVYAASMTGDGPVTGPMFHERRPSAPLSVMTLHAQDDPWIPADGRERLAFTEASQKHVGQFWAASATCPQKAERYLERSGAIRVTHFKECVEGTEIKQLAISGWNHEWPGPNNLDCKPEDDPLRDFDAAEEIWKFFAAKRRPTESQSTSGPNLSSPIVMPSNTTAR